MRTASVVFNLGKGNKSEAATKGGSHEILKRLAKVGAVWRLQVARKRKHMMECCILYLKRVRSNKEKHFVGQKQHID